MFLHFSDISIVVYGEVLPVGIYGKLYNFMIPEIWYQCFKCYFFLLDLEGCKEPYFPILFKIIDVYILSDWDLWKVNSTEINNI